MSFTRDDFLAAITAAAAGQPTVARLYQAGDPRTIASLNAMATMFSMLSQQIDVESMEPFTKTRDSTVLADAVLKGILPFARPARINLSVKNNAAAQLVIAAGRRLVGPDSRVYVAERSLSIPAGATATLAAKQITSRQIAHTVTTWMPFYSVQVPPSADADVYISGVSVSVAGTFYPYTPEFANLAAGAPGFTLETDEYRNLHAKFGWDGTFGIQPAIGTVINLTIEETGGLSALASGATFVFESSTAPADQVAKVTLESVAYAGANPVSVTALRELARYPSGFDSSAVYLGNFDFLVRRNMGKLRFLSVWNEKIEETVRAASVNNINRLFVSVLMDGMTAAALQAEVSKIIAAADDSYRIQYVAAVPNALPATVNAQVSVSHDQAAVANQIKGVLLALYGQDSEAASRGMLQLNSKRMSDELRAKVPALQDASSDFQIAIPAPTGTILPEHYRYVTEASLTVNVTQATYNDGLWSH